MSKILRVGAAAVAAMSIWGADQAFAQAKTAITVEYPLGSIFDKVFVEPETELEEQNPVIVTYPWAFEEYGDAARTTLSNKISKLRNDLIPLFHSWTIMGNRMWQVAVFSHGPQMESDDEKKVAFEQEPDKKEIAPIGAMVGGNAYPAPEASRPSLLAVPAPPGDDGRVALYDIAAHTVYMPNGDLLEAHSGLGSSFDDPRYVHKRNRGPTPPHVYELELRRGLFHGVTALRLKPVGDGDMFGRTRMLAHGYMLGPRGDSHGCVVFKEYSRFLQAFKAGEVSRLVVVTHLAAAPSSVATMERSTSNVRLRHW